jgi:thiol-disulfide isomerase/thioredoxin
MEVKMICPYCNEEAPDSNYRCPSCGKVLKPALDPSDFHRKKPKKQSSSRAANILVLAIIVVGLAVLIYAAFFRTPGGNVSDQGASSGLKPGKVERGQDLPPKRNGNAGEPDQVFNDPLIKDSGEAAQDSRDSVDSGTDESVSPSSSSISPAEEFPPGHVINAKNPGEELNIEEFVQKGKTTIFDFYSDYCGPCHQISPLLEKLDQRRDDIVVLKVDINRPGQRGIDWRSPTVQQYRLNSIPHFVIYDSSGRRTHEGRAAYSEVMNLLSSEGIIQ